MLYVGIGIDKLVGKFNNIPNWTHYPVSMLIGDCLLGDRQQPSVENGFI